MDAATLKALKQSISKWERSAVAETPDGYAIGSDNCALCELFWHINCLGCPVKDKTGLMGCDGTPYMADVVAMRIWRGDPSDNALRDAAHAAAREEAAFLRSLLPEGEDR